MQVPVIKIIAMNGNIQEIIDETNNHDTAYDLVKKYNKLYQPEWVVYSQVTGRIIAPIPNEETEIICQQNANMTKQKIGSVE